MRLTLMTDSLGRLSFEEMLDTAAMLGIETLEMPTGGYSNAPHMDIEKLLESSEERGKFIRAIESRGLKLEVLNCNGNQLSPDAQGEKDARLVEQTFQLAELLGVETIAMMSGLPGGGPDAKYANWITCCWPPVMLEMLDYQWNEVGIPYWEKTVKSAEGHGIKKIALEVHPTQIVYNVPTLLRLRNAVGPMVGANLDPSHLFFMGMDPIQAAKELGKNKAIHHVHAKDTHIEKDVADLNGNHETAAYLSTPAYERSWTYCALGYGHDVFWWKRYLMTLLQFGYDGPLSLEIEDVVMPSVIATAKSVDILKEAMPRDFNRDFPEHLLEIRGLGFDI
jgi:sugar phosphate isomerase/epimerase